MPQTAKRGLGHGHADIKQALAIARFRRVKPLKYLDLSLCAKLTGKAFAAALMLEATPEPSKQIAQVGRLIERP